MSFSAIITKIKRNFLSYIIVLIFAILIECIIFNFSYFYSKFDSSKTYNLVYNISDMTIVNWKSDGSSMISEQDPQLYIPSIDTFIDTLLISYKTNISIPYIDIFYATKNVESIDGSLSKQITQPDPNGASINMNEYVKSLRIDIADSSGTILSDITVTINPVKFNFSLSRIIAIFLIYFFTRSLFLLQKPVNYGIE